MEEQVEDKEQVRQPPLLKTHMDLVIVDLLKV